MAQEKKKNGLTAFGIITFLLALSSFIMSSIALFITWDNGRLLRDAQVVLNDLSSGIRERRSTMFYSEEQKAPVKSAGEKGKSLEYLKTGMDSIRTRFSETLDYNETGQKIEEWKKELEESQKKWGILSREKFEELKQDLNNTATSLNKKSPDATLKLDTLTDRIKVLLKED
jgi:hypothetical protein